MGYADMMMKRMACKNLLNSLSLDRGGIYVLDNYHKI